MASAFTIILIVLTTADYDMVFIFIGTSAYSPCPPKFACLDPSYSGNNLFWFTPNLPSFKTKSYFF